MYLFFYQTVKKFSKTSLILFIDFMNQTLSSLFNSVKNVIHTIENKDIAQ